MERRHGFRVLCPSWRDGQQPPGRPRDQHARAAPDSELHGLHQHVDDSETTGAAALAREADTPRLRWADPADLGTRESVWPIRSRHEYAIGVAVIEMAPGDTTVGSTPGPGAHDDIGRIHALGKPLDSQLREHRAVIGQMMAVHDVSMRIDISVGYQSPFATVSVEVGLSGGTLRHLKVRAVLVGKKAVEDMIALVRAGCRHVDARPALAVEIASHDPEQGDGPAPIVVLVERIEVALAILIGVVSRRGVE